MEWTQSPLICVRHIEGKGRGVFARTFIPDGTVIERVPLLILPIRDLWSPEGNSCLADYVFAWNRNSVALALGYGSLYNHSYEPNARYDDVGRNTKVFTAIRDISPGDEVTVNYNAESDDGADVGFEVLPDARCSRGSSDNP